MEIRVDATTTVGQKETLEASVIGVAQCGVNADVDCIAAKSQILDATCTQDVSKIGAGKGTICALVDNRLTIYRCKFRDDIPTGRAAP